MGPRRKEAWGLARVSLLQQFLVLKYDFGIDSKGINICYRKPRQYRDVMTVSPGFKPTGGH